MSRYLKKCKWLSDPNPLPAGCREISGFPFYCINSIGTVYSCRGRGGLFRQWTPMAINWNYPGDIRSRAFVSFRRDGRLFPRPIHLLVLETFVGPCPEGMEGCHNDGIPEHNHIGNLRWDTHANNMADRKKHGRNSVGSKNGSAILDEVSVMQIRKLSQDGMMQKQIAPMFGVSKQCIQTVCARTNWTHV